MQLASLVLFIAVALGFDFTNGFHDAANAIAVTVTTRAMRPLSAVAMAAALNVVGALASTKVAATIAQGIVAIPKDSGLELVFSALIGAILWNLVTWRFGLSSSSTHALIGGLVGAGIASSAVVKWGSVGHNVVIPMLTSPVIGLVLGYLLMISVLWAFRRSRPSDVNRGFRWAQPLSSAAAAFSHGTQDAQKTMGIVTLGLVVTGHLTAFRVPLWVILASGSVMGLGTLAGGWRIIRTLGSRLTPLDPPRAWASQTATSAVLLGSAYGFGFPVSSTHVMASSIVGVGVTRRTSAVRWGVGRNILAAWLLTLPAAAVAGWLVFQIVQAVVR